MSAPRAILLLLLLITSSSTLITSTTSSSSGSSTGDDRRHRHTYDLFGLVDSYGEPVLLRKDEILLDPARTTGTAAGSGGTGDGHDEVVVELRRGELGGAAVFANDLEVATSRAVHCMAREVEGSKKVCSKFLIQLPADFDFSIPLTITSHFKFSAFFHPVDRTYKSLQSPEYLTFDSPSLFYTVHAAAATLPHTFTINAPNISSRPSSSSTSSPAPTVHLQSDDSSQSSPDSAHATFPSTKDLPQRIVFPYEARHLLVEMQQTVKKVSLSATSSQATIRFSTVLQSLRTPVTVPFTSHELTEYMKLRHQTHSGTNHRGENEYLWMFLLITQSPFSSFEVQDSVGKNYLSKKSMENAITSKLRFPLVSDWKTDIDVNYKVPVTTILSTNPEDNCKILRINNADAFFSKILTGSNVKTIIELPEGATLKDVVAPHAESIESEKVSGIIRSFVRITLIHHNTRSAKITVNYFDASSYVASTLIFAAKYLSCVVLVAIGLLKCDFSIEKNSELDKASADKRQLGKLRQRIRTFIQMTRNFDTILETYKVKKNTALLNTSYANFKTNCLAYFEGEVAPIIAASTNEELRTLDALVKQIVEAHQQHIEALCDFHEQKMDRAAYINQRRLMNDVIEQAEQQVFVLVK